LAAIDALHFGARSDLEAARAQQLAQRVTRLASLHGALDAGLDAHGL